MTSRLPHEIRNLVRETHGAEIAEAAAVLPIMFMILIGIFWFGQAFSIYGTITRAAQEGARAAAAPECTTCSSIDPSTSANNAVQNALSVAHLDPTKLQRPAATPPLCACGITTTAVSGRGVVACDRSQANICIQGIRHSRRSGLTETLVQLAPVTTGPGVCGVSVSFRYPFRFWLPFTSLDNQQIWLQAQAEVRAETQ